MAVTVKESSARVVASGGCGRKYIDGKCRKLTVNCKKVKACKARLAPIGASTKGRKGERTGREGRGRNKDKEMRKGEKGSGGEGRDKWRRRGICPSPIL